MAKRQHIGVIIPLTALIKDGIAPLNALGLDACQINCWDETLYTPENAAALKEILAQGLIVNCLWAGWPGPKVWDFISGPGTLGLVPEAYRAVRIEALKNAARFAAGLGITDITTHVGFIPENPGTREYIDLIAALRDLAQYCAKLGLWFNFETGQETPVTLMRTIADIGTDNLGINLDPANLLLYGKANPIDAARLYGSLVRGVHIKDGHYPTDWKNLGQETPVGQGSVDMPMLIDVLRANGYDGPWIIEREISGEQQIRDIELARDYLLKILAS